MPNQSKRKSSTQQNTNSKKKKTKNIRAIQNGAARALGVDQLEVRNDDPTAYAYANDGDGDENDGDDDDDEENLTLQQQTLIRMAHGIETLSTVVDKFISHSTLSSNTTNSYLKSLVQKVEPHSLSSSQSSTGHKRACTKRLERSDSIFPYESHSDLQSDL